MLEVARDSEVRSFLAWAIPALGALFGLAMLALFKMTNSADSSILGMMARIFLFDYILFLFGGLSGYAMARRWRGNPEHVEELSLAPVSPSLIGHSLMSGQVAVWAACFALFFLVDLLTPFGFLMSLELFAAQEHDPILRTAFFVLSLTTHVLLCWVLAWFHFESVRLAHWMFAIHSLPKVSLVRAGITNFFVIALIVLVLSAIGSAITGGMAFFGLIAFGLLEAVGALSGFTLFSFYLVWGFLSIPGLIVVILFKRGLCRSYERAFVRAWLLYQWWGAGERTQPRDYPQRFRRMIPAWTVWHAAVEEDVAEVPLHRRRALQRYQRMTGQLPSMGKAVTIAAPPGFQPVGMPAPRDAANEDAASDTDATAPGQRM